MRLVFSACMAFLLVGCQATSGSNVRVDDRWSTGTLENGLTYHVFSSPEHEDVSIRLIFQAGSYRKQTSNAATLTLLNIWHSMAQSILKVMNLSSSHDASVSHLVTVPMRSQAAMKPFTNWICPTRPMRLKPWTGFQILRRG